MNASDDPVVSVVIPTYNNAETLPEAIASVRGQSGPPREIIVVDDGSTDATSEVLAALAGPDLRVIRQSNGGPGAARNAGIAAGRGEWIALLDADDLWLPGKLEAQFAALQRRPDARFSFGGAVVRHPDGTEITCEGASPSGSLLIHLLKGNLFPASTALIRRDCFAESGLFDTVLRTGEDWDMWLRLAAFFGGALLSQPLQIYRKSADRNKYSLVLLESCTARVLDRLFSDARIARRHPELAMLRSRVYAWHHSVLAKSYFRGGRYLRSVGRALAAVRAHPSGLRCLAPAASSSIEPWRISRRPSIRHSVDPLGTET